MIESFAALLDGLTFDDEVLAIIAMRLRETKDTETEFRAQTIERLRHQHDVLTGKIDRIAGAGLDALADGIFDAESIKTKIRSLQQERDEVQRQTTALDSADANFTQEIISLADVAHRSVEVLRSLGGSERIAFLRDVISNLSFGNGELKGDFTEPFEMIRDMMVLARGESTPPGSISPESPALGG